ncbi:MAG: hypothetical protein KKE39_02375 [Bacteroidetes bacterium]|nr:hypothetical protein [Bacteroidota bacterium]MBU1374137.1 hypothetical protein [Bacteroidota bacterium]MBU1484750.1 hypothetical protein [Bacteroidota bacterium]MBU1760147.1 hypothetical protein [Bacteroidota bacterium]MBU2045597.1 hypothetical protein [Bacteroidota bacterium]
MQKITPQYAESCKAEYQTYMVKHGVNAKTSQTNCVSFGAKALQEYFTSNNIFENSDEIRFYFGIYPADSPTGYPGAKPGRLTTIIWPYKNGKPANIPPIGGLGDGEPIDPFNLGTLQP